MADDDKRGKIDRRSLLTGVAIGGVSVGALAVGGAKLQDMQRKFATPKAVAEGAPAEVELSFADSHPAYVAARRAPAGAPNMDRWRKTRRRGKCSRLSTSPS